jgi:AmmeMemoRadiSam system protein A
MGLALAPLSSLFGLCYNEANSNAGEEALNMSDKLSAEEARILVNLAREAIVCAVRGEQAPAADLSRLPQRLREKGASFVTLLDPAGELRGCIGTVEAFAPLAHDVQSNAVGSALRDPRFLPVRPVELDGLQIELSILTPPQRLNYGGPQDLLSKIRPGIDGIIIEKGWHRATLLPSVWTRIPDPMRFLATLCLKAGLPEDEWRQPGMTVYVYEAQKIQAE